MSDNEGVLDLKEGYDNDFGGAGGERLPFVAEIEDRLLSIASVVGDSTVSVVLEIKQSSSFDFKIFKNHVKSCNDYSDIAQR